MYVQGFSVIINAIVNKCPDEMVIRMAVAIARTCLDSSAQLLEGRHYESVRRVRPIAMRTNSLRSRQPHSLLGPPL